MGFKQRLIDQGFRAVHVEAKNYTNWEPNLFELFPSKLVDLVLEDEWNKTVGRIAPTVASLFVRFRVNTLVNYDAVSRSFAVYKNIYENYEHYTAADAWWTSVQDSVRHQI